MRTIEIFRSSIGSSSRARPRRAAFVSRARAREFFGGRRARESDASRAVARESLCEESAFPRARGDARRRARGDDRRRARAREALGERSGADTRARVMAEDLRKKREAYFAELAHAEAARGKKRTAATRGRAATRDGDGGEREEEIARGARDGGDGTRERVRRAEDEWIGDAARDGAAAPTRRAGRRKRARVEVERRSRRFRKRRRGIRVI